MSDRSKQVDMDSECKDGQGSSSNDRFAQIRKQIEELEKKVIQLEEDNTKQTNEINELDRSITHLTEENEKRTDEIEKLTEHSLKLDLNINFLKQQ